MKFPVNKILDTNNVRVEYPTDTKPIDMGNLYHRFGPIITMMWKASPEGEVRDLITTRWSQIKISYFYSILQKGGKLQPLLLRGDCLVDGHHRLRAHIMNGDTDVDVLQWKT